jgi:hypothetical protein
MTGICGIVVAHGVGRERPLSRQRSKVRRLGLYASVQAIG